MIALVLGALALHRSQRETLSGLPGRLQLSWNGCRSPFLRSFSSEDVAGESEGLALAAPEEDRTAQILAVALSAFLLRDALPL